MDSGKNIYSRGCDRGRGRGRGRRGSQSGFTEQQQRTTRPPVQGNFGAVRGFQHPVQQTWSYRPQQSVQGQSYGPKQQGAGPSSGGGGIWSERPWGPTPPPPSVPPQRARSSSDNLEIQAPKISEQPASLPESVENRIVPIRRSDRGWIQSIWGWILFILGSLLIDFVKYLIVRLMDLTMSYLS